MQWSSVQLSCIENFELLLCEKKTSFKLSTARHESQTQPLVRAWFPPTNMTFSSSTPYPAGARAPHLPTARAAWIVRPDLATRRARVLDPEPGSVLQRLQNGTQCFILKLRRRHVRMDRGSRTRGRRRSGEVLGFRKRGWCTANRGNW